MNRPEKEAKTQQLRAELPPEQAARLEEFEKDWERIMTEVKTGTKRRRHKADEYDIDTRADEALAKLRERMLEAVDMDAESMEEKRPGLARIQLLPEVLDWMQKANFHDHILENGLLDVFRQWLEPLDDGSLPALDIQQGLIDGLDVLPISTDHLRESRVGRIIMFYSKCPRVPISIRRKAEALVHKWTRPILNKSSSYRDRAYEEVEYNPDTVSYPVLAPIAGKTAPHTIDASSPSGPKGDRGRASHASIPRTAAVNYEIIPRSQLKAGDPTMRRSAAEQQYRKIKQNLAKRRSEKE